MDERDLLARATELRRNPTEPEIRLWRNLSHSRTGYKFRRQHVIPPFICDFFCPARGLIVEVDGDTHDPVRDQRRDAAMNRKGYETLRFSNRDVMTNMEGVIERITAVIASRPNRWPAALPHPNPSPEGEGLEA